MIIKYTADDNDNGKVVKYILKNRMNLSERLIKKLKYQSKILLNKQPVFVNAIVYYGDVLEVEIEYDEESEDIVPQDIPIDIIYEDDCLIVINKSADIVVHPTCAHRDGTLANAVAFHLKKSGIFKKIRPVIRLDRNTTGIIIFAKNSFSQEFLIRQMNNKSFVKEYIGMVHGIVKNQAGTINLPIERKEGSIMLRHVTASGDPSITHFETLELLNNSSVLKFRLETGRTHQIRVHCQAIGHPLVGDTLYPYLDKAQTAEILTHFHGDKIYYQFENGIPIYTDAITQNQNIDTEPGIIERQALHAYKVEFLHPMSGKILQLVAPIPKDLNKAVEILKN